MRFQSYTSPFIEQTVSFYRLVTVIELSLFCAKRKYIERPCYISISIYILCSILLRGLVVSPEDVYCYCYCVIVLLCYCVIVYGYLTVITISL